MLSESQDNRHKCERINIMYFFVLHNEREVLIEINCKELHLCTFFLIRCEVRSIIQANVNTKHTANT